MKATYPERRYVNVPYQAASAAAAVMVWKDALERANSFDTERLRDALAETDLMTFYGRIKFAPTGQIDSKPMVLRQIQNGQYVVIP
jgi:branched-chain amino acid transport system substrate-binding protein